uniref:C-type lectin domain-containing protein n=1 Tax=Periophthalmus magnuspinnatus TaxID=409849 RepID=A0A3B4AKV3_9GOBI
LGRFLLSQGTASCFHTVLYEYTLINIALNWTEAQQYCRQHYTDLATFWSLGDHHTDLAMIEDETEDSAVSSLYPGAHVWIGLYREPWRWSDGSHSNFTNWYSTAPDSGLQPCAREQSTYLWNDRPCTDKFDCNYFCQFNDGFF